MPRGPREEGDDHTDVWENPSDRETTNELTPKSISSTPSPRPTLIKKIDGITIEHIGQTFSLVFSEDFYQEAILRDCFKKAPPKTAHIAIFTRSNDKPTPHGTQSYHIYAVFIDIDGECLTNKVFIGNYAINK